MGGRQATSRDPPRSGPRRPIRLPDAAAGVGRMRDVLVPSGGVVGRAAAARRARARLRRSSDCGRHPGARLCRAPARDCVLARPSRRAGAGRQHGPTASARRADARRARRAARPARAGVRLPLCQRRCRGHRAVAPDRGDADGCHVSRGRRWSACPGARDCGAGAGPDGAPFESHRMAVQRNRERASFAPQPR